MPTPSSYPILGTIMKIEVRRSSSVLYIVALLLGVCIGKYPVAPRSVLRAIASNDCIVILS